MGEGLHLAALSAAKTGIHALPYDIMGNIFSQYLLLYDRVGLRGKSSICVYLPDEPYDTNTPVLLGHVCSTWRQLSHSMPFLWSRIQILFNDYIHRGDVEMLKLWLHLSQPALLRFYIVERYSIDPRVDDICFDILKAFSSHSDRWEEADMFMLAIFQGNKCWWDCLHTPNLRRICFRRLREQQPEHVEDRREICRRLFTVSKDLWFIKADVAFFTPNFIPGVSWHNLKEVDLTGDEVPLPRFTELLELCDSLEKCQIALMSREREPLVKPPSSLSLRHLAMTVYEDPGIIIDSLELPHLRGLTIGNSMDTFEDSIETSWVALKRFSRRHSECRLHEFRYERAYPARSEDITTVLTLPLFHDLRRLHLGTFASDRTVQALTFTEGSQPLPQLEYINLEECEPTEGTISTMLLSRTRGLLSPSLCEGHILIRSWGVTGEERIRYESDRSLTIPGVELDIKIYPSTPDL